MTEPEQLVVVCQEAEGIKQPEGVAMPTDCQPPKQPMNLECGVTVPEGSSEVARVCLPSPNDGNDRDNQGPPTKRRRLNLSEKVKALNMMEDGMSLQEVADQFGASRRAMMRMRQEAGAIRALQQAGAKGTMKSRKQGNSAKYIVLENKVAEILEISRRNNISLTYDHVRTCALRVREELLKKPTGTPEEIKDLHDFHCTDFWVKGFARRKNIKLVSKAFQIAIQPPTDPVSKECHSLRITLQKFDPDCIFHVQETTLFHKILPRRGYLTSASPSTNQMKVLPGDMAINDRLTLLVCTNATGTCKVPICLVGAEKRPKCFRLQSSPLPYLTHQNAWFDRTTFKQWFNEVFLPVARKHSWRNTALLVDNCLHDHVAEDYRGQVSIIPLPQDFKQKEYPMGCAVIPVLKQKYRYELLNRVIELLPAREEIQGFSSRKAQVFRGLDDGEDPNILDTAEMLHLIWEKTSEQSIARSWIGAAVLPDACVAFLASKNGKSQAFDQKELLLESCESDQRETINSIDEKFRTRNFRAREVTSADVGNLLTTFCLVGEKEFEAWLALEDRPDIKSALVREAQEKLLSPTALNFTNGAHTNDEMSCTNPAQVTHNYDPEQSLPSLAAVAELFAPIEELISACDTGEVATHIRQAKRLLFAAKAKELRYGGHRLSQGSGITTSDQPPSSFLGVTHRI